jgi:hypothetical protein
METSGAPFYFCVARTSPSGVADGDIRRYIKSGLGG